MKKLHILTQSGSSYVYHDISEQVIEAAISAWEKGVCFAMTSLPLESNDFIVKTVFRSNNVTLMNVYDVKS